MKSFQYEVIGVVTVSDDTFTNPTLFALIKKLNDQGHKTLLFNKQNQLSKPSDLDLVTYLNGPKGFQTPKRPSNFFKYLYTYWNVIKHIKARKITNLIAVDPIGLIVAGRIKRVYKKINIHYFSFEIFFSDELEKNATYLSLKKKEIYYTKSVSSIVIQDEERKKKLISENKINPHFNNWYLIPVAPIINYTGNKYDRVMYGIKESDIVYIHSGSIGKWAGINQIIKAVEDGLPEDTIIFIHSRSRFELSNPIHQKLITLSANYPNLVLHDEIFDNYEDYLSFLKIFDYGIVLYQPDGGVFTGKNIQEIGLASGKFSTYMATGLPSLLFNCTTYEEIVKKYAIGTIVLGESDLSFHIKNNSLKTFKKKDCVDFYYKMLNPELNINSFISKELMKNRNLQGR